MSWPWQLPQLVREALFHGPNVQTTVVENYLRAHLYFAEYMSLAGVLTFRDVEIFTERSARVLCYFRPLDFLILFPFMWK